MTAQSFRLPPPPANASSFFTDDLDEVREFVGRSDGEHSRVVHGVGRLDFERHVLIGKSVALAWNRVALGQTVRGALGALTLHLSIDAPGEYLFGRRRIRVAPGSGMILPPRWEFTRRSGPGSMFGLALNDQALNAETARGGRSARVAGCRTPAPSICPVPTGTRSMPGLPT
ncbi:MAG: hypothetical protein IPG84_04975 [Betaproteobacteria bacterium]|nr:hypothetical protein [Betaproteobacteria bacterium]